MQNRDIFILYLSFIVILSNYNYCKIFLLKNEMQYICIIVTAVKKS